MGKIAFVFAGQGSQYVGMGKGLYETFSSARKVFDLAGENVTSLSFEGPAEDLNITVNTQPCLFAMDLACARVLEEHGVRPDGAAGFSLGEIPALAFSGLMSDGEAFDFVRMRAKSTQKCAEETKGAMLAVLKLSREDVVRICSGIPNAYPVNFNCPGQTVVACAEESLIPLQEAVQNEKGKAIRLAVSGAFHSPLMEKASDEIARFLSEQKFGRMEIPVYANATASVYTDPKTLLSEQVKKPVLWQQTIETMVSDGFDLFIEVGAGKTLSGLIRKIDPSVKTLNVSDLASLEETCAEVQHA